MRRTFSKRIALVFPIAVSLALEVGDEDVRRGGERSR